MQRRRFLAGVTPSALVGIAGCADGENFADATRRSPTPTPFPNPGGLAVADRQPVPGDPVGVRAVVANGAARKAGRSLVRDRQYRAPDGGD